MPDYSIDYFNKIIA
jgi:hypothetical protein